MTTLSILDQSPIPHGSSARDAYLNSIDLARHAERFGYQRYWVAEHHNSDALAGSAPEILIGAIAGATQHIRVGSGGIMLPHYSPLKVAEVFRALETLYPARIDLGIGRAPGTDRRTSAALQPGPQAYDVGVFPQQIELLIQFLEDANGLIGEAGGFPSNHPYRGIHASPRGPGMPELWMLGSGGDGAIIAAQFGMPYCFAHFINQDAGTAPIDAYRQHFRASSRLAEPHASIGVTLTVAETEDEARRVAAARNLWVVRFLQNRVGALPTTEEALSYPYTEEERAMLRGIEQRSITGTPEQARAGLLHMGEEYGVDDFVILTITHDHADRIRSYELLAKAFGLC